MQRALALGACSQEAEARAGKASFPDSAICEQTSCMSKRPLPSLFLSYGSQCRQRAELHKHLPFAQKLSAYAHLLVQRALVMGACGRDWIYVPYRTPLFHRKEFMHRRKLVGSQFSPQSDRVSKCHVQRATSTQDGFLVTEGPGLRSGAHLRRHQLPKR